MANETRKRANALSGTIDNNPLSNSGTSLVSTELAAVPAVDATEYMVGILDPDADGNGPEIFYITAHTAASTGATIVRGREGTSGVSHTSTMTWVIGPTVADFPNHVTAATNPSGTGLPYRGQEIFETDTYKKLQYTTAATGWNAFWNMPWGIVGYASKITNQAGFTSTPGDVATLTITATYVANRRIKITGYGRLIKLTSTAHMTLGIYEGTTRLNADVAFATIVTAQENLKPVAIVSPTAGSHTYKLMAVSEADTCDLTASATDPAFILIEDLGPTANPT